jgi:hypothetical protein
LSRAYSNDFRERVVDAVELGADSDTDRLVARVTQERTLVHCSTTVRDGPVIDVAYFKAAIPLSANSGHLKI